MFSKTNWLGVLIGKSPFVSVGEIVQSLSAELLLFWLSPSLEQDSNNFETVAIETRPKILFFYEFFSVHNLFFLRVGV